MMKRLFALFLALAVLLSVTAVAVDARASVRSPTLTFAGSVATCAVKVYADSPRDEIEIDVYLYMNGTTLVESWSDSGYGEIDFEETCTVTRRKTYKLTVVATINGEEQSPVSVTATCS